MRPSRKEVWFFYGNRCKRAVFWVWCIDYKTLFYMRGSRSVCFFKNESCRGSSEHSSHSTTELPFTLSSLAEIPTFSVAVKISHHSHVYYSCYRAQEGVCTGLLWLAGWITHISYRALGTHMYSYKYRGPKLNTQKNRKSFLKMETNHEWYFRIVGLTESWRFYLMRLRPYIIEMFFFFNRLLSELS